MKYGISDMRITNGIPESWQDLQDKVSKYLNQAGYHAETTKTIGKPSIAFQALKQNI